MIRIYIYIYISVDIKSQIAKYSLTKYIFVKLIKCPILLLLCLFLPISSNMEIQCLHGDIIS